MTTPNGDLGRRLRDHYRSQTTAVPDEAIAGAQRRIGDPRPRRAPFLLAAAIMGAIALAAVVSVIGSPPSTQAPTRPSAASISTPAQSPVRSPAALYDAGQLLRATRGFRLSGDWMVGTGQSMFVVAREPDGPGDVYTIQHWGDLITGLRPDTVMGTIATDIVDRSTEPYEPACPTAVDTVEQVAALQPFERLVCFGDAEISFEPVRREEYAVMQGDPPWVAGAAGLDFFTALPFDAADGIDVPTRAWLRITGHFDDPGCAGDLACRERFRVTAVEPADPPSSELQGVWDRMAAAPIAGRSSYVAVPIDRGTLIWGGDMPGEARSGAIYDAATNRWSEIATAPGVDRIGFAVAWSGESVLIWGGNDTLADGLAYDPEADRWSRIPDAPIAGASAVGAWTGSEFVVVSTRAEAAAWDPAARSWRRLPDPPLPVGYLESAWTGRRFVVLGLTQGGADPIVGAAFDPETSTWTAIDDVPYDGSVLDVPARWTGTEMVFVNHAYDPVADRWRELVTDDCSPEAVSYGVWTGRWLMTQTRAYDLAAGRCQTLPKAPARPAPGDGELVAHEFHTPFWSAGRLVVWSGGSGSDVIFTGPDGVTFTPADP